MGLFRETGLRQRIFLSALAAVMLVCGAIVYQSRSILRISLTQEFERRGVGIALSVAQEAAGRMVEGDQAGLVNLLFDAKWLPSRRGLVAYVFVRDMDGRLLAHTFVQPIPAGLADLDSLPDGVPYRIREISYPDGRAMDIAVPVLDAGIYRIGTVHLGLSQEHLEALFRRLRTTSVLFISAMLVLLFLASNWILGWIADRERRAMQRVMEERSLVQQDRIEGLQKLAMGVAHQLRNPITIIGGYAKGLKRRDELCACGEQLDGIFDAARRIEWIAKVVQEYTTIRLREKRLERLSEVVREASGRSMRRAEERGFGRIEVLHEIPDAALVSADRPLLVQALVDILDNACEAVREGGVIKVSARSEGDGVVIEVADNGRGISDDDLPFVFDPFFSTKAVGVGIGLSRAYRILQEHGGSVSLTTSPSGTSVFLRLPSSLAS